MYKVYIALFTCASLRAVHLDLVPSLHVQPFIRCLRCFVSCSYVAVLFISDNGKTFKASDLKQFLLKNGVQWKFNLPKSPWWGGFFERLVQSTKRCLKKVLGSLLKKVLGSSKLTYEELLTVLVEVECVLNSRPLTYVYSEEAEEPLTPSHLLLGHHLLSKSASTSSSESLETEEQVSRRAKYLKILLRHFWKRWYSEYLSELREHHRYSSVKSTAVSPSVQNGDVVIIKEDNVARNLWKLGRVEELIMSEDSHVRGAIVRVARAGKPSVLLQRPIQCLYPLEVSHVKNSLPTNDIKIDRADDDTKEFVADPVENILPVENPRVRRTAVIEGELRRRYNNYED